LPRAGEIRIERSSSLDDLFPLHRVRWEDRNEGDMLAETRLQAFHREVVFGFEKLGILRLYRLCLDEQPFAVICAFTHNKRTYAYGERPTHL
jgi:hypothetical protein